MNLDELTDLHLRYENKHTPAGKLIMRLVVELQRINRRTRAWGRVVRGQYREELTAEQEAIRQEVYEETETW